MNEGGATRDRAKAMGRDPGEAAPRALVLAGRRRSGDALAEAAGVSHKALLPVGGRPLLARVLDALAEAGVGEAHVCAESSAVLDALPPPALPTGFLPSAASPVESALAAIAELGGAPLLVTTGDHPLLHAPLVAHFVDAAQSSDADLCVGVVAGKTVDARFPESPRTFVRLGDERFTGANLFWLRRDAGLRVVSFWRRTEEDRKSPWRLARHIGARVLARYALGQLRLDEVFDHVSARSGARVAPIVLPFAEAAVDVDTEQDLALVRSILG